MLLTCSFWHQKPKQIPGSCMIKLCNCNKHDTGSHRMSNACFTKNKIRSLNAFHLSFPQQYLFSVTKDERNQEVLTF